MTTSESGDNPKMSSSSAAASGGHMRPVIHVNLDRNHFANLPGDPLVIHKTDLALEKAIKAQDEVARTIDSAAESAKLASEAAEKDERKIMEADRVLKTAKKDLKDPILQREIDIMRKKLTKTKLELKAAQDEKSLLREKEQNLIKTHDLWQEKFKAAKVENEELRRQLVVKIGGGMCIPMMAAVKIEPVSEEQEPVASTSAPKAADNLKPKRKYHRKIKQEPHEDNMEWLLPDVRIKQEETGLQDLSQVKVENDPDPGIMHESPKSTTIYSCDFPGCSTASRHKANLKRHMKSHHGAICGMTEHDESDPDCPSIRKFSQSPVKTVRHRRFPADLEGKVRRIKREHPEDDDESVSASHEDEYLPGDEKRAKIKQERKTLNARRRTAQTPKSPFLKAVKTVVDALIPTRNELINLSGALFTESIEEKKIVTPPSIRIIQAMNQFGLHSVKHLAIVFTRKGTPKSFRSWKSGSGLFSNRLEIETNLSRKELFQRLEVIKGCTNLRSLALWDLYYCHEGAAIDYLREMNLHYWCPFIEHFIVGENEAPIFADYVLDIQKSITSGEQPYVMKVANGMVQIDPKVNHIHSLEIKVSYHHNEEIAEAISHCDRLDMIYMENSSPEVIEACVNHVRVFSSSWTTQNEFDTFTELAKDKSRIELLQLSLVHLPMDRLRFKSLGQSVPKLTCISVAGDLNYIHYLKYFPELRDVKWETVPFNISEGYKDKYVRSHWDRKQRKLTKHQQEIFQEKEARKEATRKVEKDTDSDDTDIDSDVSLSDYTDENDDSTGTDVGEEDDDNNIEINYLQAKRNKSDIIFKSFLNSVGSKLNSLDIILDNKYSYKLFESLPSSCPNLVSLAIHACSSDTEFLPNSFYIPTLRMLTISGSILKDNDLLGILDHNPIMHQIILEGAVALTAKVIPYMQVYAAEYKKRCQVDPKLPRVIQATFKTYGYEEFLFQLFPTAVNNNLILNYTQERAPPIPRKSKPNRSSS